MAKFLILWLLLVAPALAQGNLVTRWRAATTSEGRTAQQLLQSDPIHQRLASYVNETYKLPRNLPVVYSQEGKINAWYSPSQHQITVSYDLVVFLVKFFRKRGLPNPEERARETVAFILLHELGHALIHELDLPVVGREEDAADEFATLISLQLLGSQGTQMALTSAQWFSLMGQSQTVLQEVPFWDEHSLDKQRFFKILCLIYGSNPTANEAIVKPLVPYTRLRVALERHSKKVERWQRLLGPQARLHRVFPDPTKPRSLNVQKQETLLPQDELMRVAHFTSLAADLNRWFRLPKNLTVVYRATQMDKNFFLPMTGQLLMSREFFQSAQQRLAQRLPQPQQAETMRALESFSLLQEFSLALIYDCDLAITGEPEDAAAELTLMMVVTHPQLRSLAIPMSRWYETLAADQVNVLQLKYWSESALDQQRFYDLLGYLYWADPVTYAALAKKFEPKRLQKLGWEYRLKKRNWQRLLKPYTDSLLSQDVVQGFFVGNDLIGNDLAVGWDIGGLLLLHR